jgi:hypothetical protein
MTEHRWSKFWWSDYEGDDALRVVSLAAQGLWMRMLCAMHKGTPYGHLTINGQPPTERQIGMLASVSEGKTKKLVQELEKSGVFSRTETGVIFCRRMVRDKEISERGQQDGKRGGNPALKPKAERGLTPPVIKPPYALEAEAEAEAEADSKRESAPRAATPRPRRGGRLPDSWVPSDPTLPAQRGHDPATVLAKFRAHYRAADGAKGISADWDASWVLWCEREKDFARPKPKLHTLTPAEQDRRILAAVGLNFDDPKPEPLRIAQ